jgi:GT2 family glycosyltransferase
MCEITQTHPLVTILIATKDRPDDLARTLHDLHRQDYPAIEMIVIDDGSTCRLEQIVREEWPDAVYVRQAISRGQSQRRSEGFLLARGEYILQLDDDSSPVEPGAIRLAVERMCAMPKVGILSFHIFNGAALPVQIRRGIARYTTHFVGCGALMRTSAVRHIAGYQSFFCNEWEESEFAIRVLKAGWLVYFLPDVLIHHHLSPRNRHVARTWMRGFRNKLWSEVMHLPMGRLFLEGAWTIAVALWDSLRLLRPRHFFVGIGQFAMGLPKALKLRQPMSPAVLRLYDALRFHEIRTAEECDRFPRVTLVTFWQHYRNVRSNRPRQRSFWDRRAGDTGSSTTVTFAHESDDRSCTNP